MIEIQIVKNGAVIHTSRHRTDDELEALGRAIRKGWGARAIFYRDQSLADIGVYGQIMEPQGQQRYSALTPRVRVDATEVI